MRFVLIHGRISRRLVLGQGRAEAESLPRKTAETFVAAAGSKPIGPLPPA